MSRETFDRAIAAARELGVVVVGSAIEITDEIHEGNAAHFALDMSGIYEYPLFPVGFSLKSRVPNWERPAPLPSEANYLKRLTKRVNKK